MNWSKPLSKTKDSLSSIVGGVERGYRTKMRIDGLVTFTFMT